MLLDFASAVPQVTPLAFDATGVGYAVVLIDSRQHHSVHTEEFASVPADMRMVANHLGVARLGDTTADVLLANLQDVRAALGDGRAMRALHYFDEVARVDRQREALEAGDFPLFLKCVRLSGASSAQFLQNVSPRDTGSGSANRPCSSRAVRAPAQRRGRLAHPRRRLRRLGAGTRAPSRGRRLHGDDGQAARLPRLPRGGRGRPRRAGEAAVVSGVARGVEGASGYAVDERGNPFWTYSSPAGPLEITVNLVKPEKDPRDIAAAAGTTLGGAALEATPAGEGEAAATTVEGDARKGLPLPRMTCDLCWEPSGEDGPAHLRRSGAPVTEVALGGEPWAWWFSPYGYFPEHLIVASREHRPMAIDHGTIARLLDFSDAYPRWFIGSNADLPIVGGSLLGHDHFQSGGHRFPLMNAPIARAFSIEGLESVEAGIVRWPASVVRLRSCDRRLLAEAASRVLDAWRPFSFEECDIRAFSLVPGDGREGAVSAFRRPGLARAFRAAQHGESHPVARGRRLRDGSRAAQQPHDAGAPLRAFPRAGAALPH
ncbi:MAG: hypothetical protein ACLTDR_01580 [Adlercreutzia equolifaciens]